MKSHFKWVPLAVLTTFGLLQLASPKGTNPRVGNDFLTSTKAPPEIEAMLRSSCYDCHSYETHWPWYSHIAPISLAIVSDVNKARSRLNLSQWPADHPARAIAKLQAMIEEIESGNMPLARYKMIHPESRLTPSQRKELAGWLSSLSSKLESDQNVPGS